MAGVYKQEQEMTTRGGVTKVRRVFKIKDGENPPEGAEAVPDDTPLHEWTPIDRPE